MLKLKCPCDGESKSMLTLSTGKAFVMREDLSMRRAINFSASGTLRTRTRNTALSIGGAE